MRRLERFRPQAVKCEGPEGARGLVANQRATSPRFPRGECRRLSISNPFNVAARKQHFAPGRIRRQLEIAFRNCSDERTWRQRPVGLARGMGNHDLPRSREPALSDAPVEGERGLGRRFRDTGCALQRKRQEGCRACGQWPGVRAQPHDPEMVELAAGRFEHAQDLDRHVRRLGLKRSIGRDAAQARHGLAMAHPWHYALELRELGKHGVPLLERLVFGRIERTPAGKSDQFKCVRERKTPLGRGLHAKQAILAKFGKSGQQLHQPRGQPLPACQRHQAIERQARFGAPAQ